MAMQTYVNYQEHHHGTTRFVNSLECVADEVDG